MPPDQLTNLSPNKTPKSFVQSDESNSDFSNRENAESHYNNFNSNFCIVNKIENIHPNGEIRFSQNAEISGINPIQLLTFSEGDVPGCFDIVRRSSH
ncbi:hypothetical protein TRFO_22037 [Tritrichomonas foetus]|uniref:Uncharacterized protein n=1 Tax=Tritrichomonas foetus TaxID=1144522 RepID=A0A1J4KCP5_9EUKA|nr:hypothetical protein TRFO_22037 [Tritrichomonas foetus]|eukprot:OHT09199.1 hypothetical protein TRFO_22037 [Tritrichomonas foetus]